MKNQFIKGAVRGDLAGVYSEIAEEIGIENAYRLYKRFKGQQMTFPIRFYSGSFVAKQICNEYDGENIRELTQKYGYSESRIRQILREGKEDEPS